MTWKLHRSNGPCYSTFGKRMELPSRSYAMPLLKTNPAWPDWSTTWKDNIWLYECPTKRSSDQQNSPDRKWKEIRRKSAFHRQQDIKRSLTRTYIGGIKNQPGSASENINQHKRLKKRNDSDLPPSKKHKNHFICQAFIKRLIYMLKFPFFSRNNFLDKRIML